MMKNTTRPLLAVFIFGTASLFASTAMAQDYCPPDTYTLGVEPICHLAFADIDNNSPGDASAPPYEDFTALVAHLEAGATYTVTASGFTGGTPPDQLAANFDWNGDYTFETHVELADITGDVCSTESSATFTVPADAAIGTSRVRFVKTFTYNADDDGCAWGSNYGQAEDYTVSVAVATGIAETAHNAFRVYPNPSNGTITLLNLGNAPVTNIAVTDVTGRMVYSEQAVSTAASHTLNLAGVITPGTYTATLTNGADRTAARFIVQ